MRWAVSAGGITPEPTGVHRWASAQRVSRCARRVLETAGGFAGVEVDVATLLLGDPAHQLGERRMAGPLSEPHVRRLGGPLVHRTPGQRHRHDVLGQRRCEHRGQRAESPTADPLTCGVDARPAGDLAVCPQHLADRLAVPELLVRPHGEKAGDHRIVVGTGHEEVAQVAHGVVLDVVHVPQAAQRIVGQGMATEVVVVDVGIVERGNGCDVAVDVEVHVQEFVGKDDPVWSDAPDRPVPIPSRIGRTDLDHHRRVVIEHYRAVWQEMIGPGGPFAMTEIEVRGVPVRVFDAAPPTMRTAVGAGGAARRQDLRRLRGRALHLRRDQRHVPRPRPSPSRRRMASSVATGSRSRCGTIRSGSWPTGPRCRSAPRSSA